MEDDLKLFELDYLCNHWSNLTQILNLSLYDQTKVLRGNIEEILSVALLSPAFLLIIKELFLIILLAFVQRRLCSTKNNMFCIV